jgi:hypothetical protein
MSDVLKELEDSWGVARDQWSPDRWKRAALLIANALIEYSKASDDCIQTNEELRNSANALIELLKERLEKSEALNIKLTGWINNKLIKKPAGRPRKEKPTHNVFRDLFKPSRGQPPKYIKRDKEILVAFIDSKKMELKLNDIQTLRHIHREITGVNREKQVIQNAKLLSRFRKEIAELK